MFGAVGGVRLNISSEASGTKAPPAVKPACDDLCGQLPHPPQPEFAGISGWLIEAQLCHARRSHQAAAAATITSVTRFCQ